jgi:hypothetical protein
MTPASGIERASFAFNFALFEDPAVAPNLLATDPVVSESIVGYPAETTMFYHSKYQPMNVVNPDAPVGSPYNLPTGPLDRTNFPGTMRYSKGVGINFADGHAKHFNGKAVMNVPDGPDLNQAGNPIVRTYNLPYDLNGIPDFVGEPRT